MHELDYHKQSHLCELMYKCPLCKTTFSLHSDLILHLKSSHGNTIREKKAVEKEIKKLGSSKTTALSKYNHCRRQYNSQDSDGVPREQNPIGMFFYCEYCNRKFSVFHSKVIHESQFCKKRWSMVEKRNLRVGPLNE